MASSPFDIADLRALAQSSHGSEAWFELADSAAAGEIFGPTAYEVLTILLDCLEPHLSASDVHSRRPFVEVLVSLAVSARLSEPTEVDVTRLWADVGGWNAIVVAGIRGYRARMPNGAMFAAAITVEQDDDIDLGIPCSLSGAWLTVAGVLASGVAGNAAWEILKHTVRKAFERLKDVPRDSQRQFVESIAVDAIISTLKTSGYYAVQSCKDYGDHWHVVVDVNGKIHRVIIPTRNPGSLSISVDIH